MKAEYYFSKEYNEDHIFNVVQTHDLKYIYALMEEYHQEQLKEIKEEIEANCNLIVQVIEILDKHIK